MIETYKTNGRFPVSFEKGHTFKGPIQCHYRPRRLCTLITSLVTSYFSVPPVARACITLFTSGVWSVMIGVLLVLLSNFIFIRTKNSDIT